MNLEELLSFKPQESLGKRPLAQIGSEDSRPAKLLRVQDPSGGAINLDGATDKEKLRQLHNLDDIDETGEILDASAVKRMLLAFEKKVLRNQEMRIKFPDLPEKFMESEVDLNDEIMKLHVIATVPEYYLILIEMNVVQTLLGMLSHDNTDISIAVVDFLQELTDVDTLSENQEEAEGLIDALLSEQIIALLVQNLERLDEKVREEADGVFNTLAIVENMCEIKSKEVSQAGGEQGLVVWLMKRVRLRQYDPNKLYASEILAILLQSHKDNQRLVGEKDGIDILLQTLAYYKRRDPGGVDEIEMMENLFDCLCACLMFTPNRNRFLQGEGLQLMILMLKENKMSRKSAIKVLNYALCDREGADNCNKFVEVYGLRSLFPCFMKTPKKSKKAGTNKIEHEEHVCSIIASLFRNVQGKGHDRLVSKFGERDHEKVERLMELHFSYLRRIRVVDRKLSTKPQDADGEDIYIQRLDAGLYTLQMIDYIIAELCVSDKGSIKSRIATLLNQQGDSVNTIKEVLLEYAENLGIDEGNEVSAHKQTLMNLVDQL